MNLSLILTINNRTPEVSKQVADSLKLPGNQPDELVLVLDRASPGVREGAVDAFNSMNLGFPVLYVNIDGEPGWKGPAKAWNAGFKAATGDLFYCISSEVVQDERNIEKAKNLMIQWKGDGDPWARLDRVVFGACHNSVKTQLVTGADPGLLVSSKMARPLGFIVCMPAKNVRDIRGFDEAFMKGFWYDDDDFFLRMWKTGLDFVFDDSIHGIHLDHERPGLESAEGQAGIERNRQTMVQKHGTMHPWGSLPRVETKKEGQTIWTHL